MQRDFQSAVLACGDPSAIVRQSSPFPVPSTSSVQLRCCYTYTEPTSLVFVRWVIEVDGYAALAVRGGVRGFEEIVRTCGMECTYDVAVRKIKNGVGAVLSPDKTPHKGEIRASVLSTTNGDN